MNDEQEPSIRINKYLGEAGYCSRRQCDRMIEQQRIYINGKPAQKGQRIRPGDRVEADGQEVVSQTRHVLLALNKPEGIECTTNPQVKENVVDYVNFSSRIYPIGRLDKNSCGLLLLTNDGSIVNEILKASNLHEKEYVVTVNRPIDQEFCQRMAGGLRIKQYDREKKTYYVTTRPCKVLSVDGHTFRIVLTQGYNRQIRRMCQCLGYEVVHLRRIRIMGLKLGDLAEGKYREIQKEDLWKENATHG